MCIEAGERAGGGGGPASSAARPPRLVNGLERAVCGWRTEGRQGSPGGAGEAVELGKYLRLARRQGSEEFGAAAPCYCVPEGQEKRARLVVCSDLGSQRAQGSERGVWIGAVLLCPKRARSSERGVCSGGCPVAARRTVTRPKLLVVLWATVAMLK